MWKEDRIGIEENQESSANLSWYASVGKVLMKLC
jgi:hypothetical protein